MVNIAVKRQRLSDWVLKAIAICYLKETNFKASGYRKIKSIDNDKAGKCSS